MVMNATEARDNYEAGIQKIGVSAYRNAAGTNSPSEAAEILESAKQDRLSVSDMGESYEQKY